MKYVQAYTISHSHVLVDRPAKRARWANQANSGYTDVELPILQQDAQEQVQFRPARRIKGKRPAKSINWACVARKRQRVDLLRTSFVQLLSIE